MFTHRLTLLIAGEETDIIIRCADFLFVGPDILFLDPAGKQIAIVPRGIVLEHDYE
jgi:hypothetical protein